MMRLRRKVLSASSLEALRGFEGAAAAAHFGLLRRYLKDPMGFATRNAHPPTDPINALLSLGYSLVYNNVLSALHVVGLDPYQGFFHGSRSGHASLASDIMEEFRPVIVDSLVLTLVNKGAIRQADFGRERGGVMLSELGLKTFLEAFNQKMDTPVQPRRLPERRTYLRWIEVQVAQLARIIRGEQETYEPFVLK